MTTLSLTGIRASHGSTAVLHGVDLEVPSGATTAVVGPSGCGKTTLLRVIAGLHTPDDGVVRLGEKVVAGDTAWVPAERRGIGLVGQDGNLFPHLTVRRNVTFGLPLRERRSHSRVDELLDLVGLPRELAGRYPAQLSGGQQQRVALARALAPRPAVVLLDEPFSALDAGLRAATREAVASVLRHEGVTALLVTHDQGEALSFADQVAIMHDGVFSQVGAPWDVYAAPRDRRSAEFLGEAVFFTGTPVDGVLETSLGRLDCPGVVAGEEVEVMIRPEQVVLCEPGVGAGAAEVVSTTYYGHDALVTLKVEDGGVVITSRVAGTRVPERGTRVGFRVEGAVRAFAEPWPLEASENGAAARAAR